MSEWKTCIVSDIALFKNGKRKPNSIGLTPVYGGNGIMGYVEESNNENVVIVGRVGAYCGSVYYCPGNCWVSDNAIVVKNNQNSNISFLYYLLTSLNLNRYNIGCAQPLMTQDLIGRIKIFVPPLNEQNNIASILSSLDDKIANNRRICENLEAQAQALFKHWFIDFAPFKNGNFVESELGMIPEGWRVGTLGEIAEQVKTIVGNREDIKVLSPINTGHLVLSDEFFTKQVYSKSISKYILVEPFDFAYNPARVNIGSLGMNKFNFCGCVSPVYVVFRCKNPYYYFMDVFRSRELFKKNVQTLSIGGVRQILRYDDFARISLVIPPVEIVNEFNAIYGNYEKMKDKLFQEIQHLATLRDTLLPKLMSGQIKL